MDDITDVLNRVQAGGAEGQEHLVESLYEELKVLARQKMASESQGHTLQPADLVHEVWLKLVIPCRSTWKNRAHFFGAASETMRRILVDHARRKQRMRRHQEAELEQQGGIMLNVPPEEVLVIHEALEQLSKDDPQVAELVKLRYYAGMNMAESATALALSTRTAERLWSFGRAWLSRHVRQSLSPQQTTGPIALGESVAAKGS